MVRTLQGPYLITTSPSITTCRGCRKGPVLAVTINGLDRHIDPTCLTWQGELAAVLAGLKTYELHGELFIERSEAKIAGSWSGPIMAEHTCGRRWRTEEMDPDVMKQAVAAVQAMLGGTPLLPDEPPF